MDATYWHKQTSDQPLFPELVWSKPENRQHAGKLLIIGGNAHGFSAPAEAYNTAIKTGVGMARVLLPDSLKKLVGPVLENCEFAPSTPSGSFSGKALAEILDLSLWADAVLLAGDLGRNSETAILIEKLISKFNGQLTATKDTVDYLTNNPSTIQVRPNTTIVLSIAQLQKLLIAIKYPEAISFDMSLIRLVDLLHNITSTHKLNIIVKHLQNILVASNGQVSTTKIINEREVWRVEQAAKSSVWWLQNPSKTFEALTVSVIN